jgi:hypothetical protein
MVGGQWADGDNHAQRRVRIERSAACPWRVCGRNLQFFEGIGTLCAATGSRASGSKRLSGDHLRRRSALALRRNIRRDSRRLVLWLSHTRRRPYRDVMMESAIVSCIYGLWLRRSGIHIGWKCSKYWTGTIPGASRTLPLLESVSLAFVAARPYLLRKNRRGRARKADGSRYPPEGNLADGSRAERAVSETPAVEGFVVGSSSTTSSAPGAVPGRQ